MDLIAGIFIGLWLRELSGSFVSLFRKAKPKPEIKAPPPRAIGDLVADRNGLPLVLLRQLSFDKFEGCYITPHTKQLCAPGKDNLTFDELEDLLLTNVQNRDVWPDYTAPLSDEEHRNYAKAMLEDDK